MSRSNQTPWEAWRDGMLMLAGLLALMVLTLWEFSCVMALFHSQAIPWGWFLTSVVLVVLGLAVGSFAERFKALRNGLFGLWCVTTLIVWVVGTSVHFQSQQAAFNLAVAQVGLALPWGFAPLIALGQWLWRVIERREAVA